MDIGPLIGYLTHVGRLKLLPRTGWLLNGVAPSESVAEHTCAVALLAMALAGEINADWAAHGLEEPLNLGRVAQLALLHDLPESIVTDLPKRSTALIGADRKHAAEQQAMAHLAQGLQGAATMQVYWAEYDAGATWEAKLVRDADKLEMVYQALCYERRGCRTLDEFWQGHRWSFELSRVLFEELRKMRG